MYFRDHAPAHFHAEYGEYEITVDIETGVITGKFPRRALSAVMEWHQLRKDELMANWKAARNRKPLSKNRTVGVDNVLTCNKCEIHWRLPDLVVL